MAIAYSVLQYRFMDIVLKRSLVYSLLSGVLLGVYLFGVNYGAAWLLPDTGQYSLIGVREFYPGISSG